MATDPVCGMSVDEATGISEKFDGEMLYFCSQECREQFLLESDPARLEKSVE